MLCLLLLDDSVDVLVAAFEAAAAVVAAKITDDSAIGCKSLPIRTTTNTSELIK